MPRDSNSSKKAIIGGAVPALLLSAASLLAGCDAASETGRDVIRRPSLLPANVIRVTRDETPLRTVVSYAELRAEQQTQVAFARPGTVAVVFKARGDQVREGETLAELDLSPLQARQQVLRERLDTLLRQTVAAPATQVSALQQQSALVEDELFELTAEISKGVLLASAPGFVSEVNIEVGTLVSPSQPAFAISPSNEPIVEAIFSGSAAAGLRQDQAALATIGSEVVTAELRSITTLPSSESRMVSMKLSSIPRVWEFGQTIEVQCRLPASAPGFWLPMSALRQTVDGPWSVLVAVNLTGGGGESPHRVEARSIRIVHIEDEAVLVDGILSEGELVIASGLHRVVPGQHVRTIDVSGEYQREADRGVPR